MMSEQKMLFSFLKSNLQLIFFPLEVTLKSKTVALHLGSISIEMYFFQRTLIPDPSAEDMKLTPTSHPRGLSDIFTQCTV